MTAAPPLLDRTDDTWPGDRNGWVALIQAAWERAGQVYGPAAASWVRRGLEAATLHVETMPANLDSDTVRGLSKTYGPLIVDVHDQPERAASGPLDTSSAVAAIDNALTDWYVTRRASLPADEPVNLAGAGAHILAHLHDRHAAIYPAPGSDR